MSTRRSERLIAQVPAVDAERVFAIVEIGLHHEQQHQELLITDILHAFAQNPTDPVYDPNWQAAARNARAARATSRCPQAFMQSATTVSGFCFDNETPFHDELIPRERSRGILVTNAEWLEFIVPLAATRHRRFGSPMAGPRCRRKAGRHPAIGAKRRRLARR